MTFKWNYNFELKPFFFIWKTRNAIYLGLKPENQFKNTLVSLPLIFLPFLTCSLFSTYSPLHRTPPQLYQSLSTPSLTMQGYHRPSKSSSIKVASFFPDKPKPWRESLNMVFTKNHLNWTPIPPFPTTEPSILMTRCSSDLSCWVWTFN